MFQGEAWHVTVFIISIIAAIGAINWLFTAFNQNLVEKLGNKGLIKAIYVIIGLCGIFLLVAKIMFVQKYGFNYSCSPM